MSAHSVLLPWQRDYIQTIGADVFTTHAAAVAALLPVLADVLRCAAFDKTDKLTVLYLLFHAHKYRLRGQRHRGRGLRTVARDTARGQAGEALLIIASELRRYGVRTPACPVPRNVLPTHRHDTYLRSAPCPTP